MPVYSASWARVVTRRREALVVQFGGASGTMAALGDKGLDVAEALARELNLSCPDAPWHSYGDRLAAMVAASAIYTGVLGKMARDISLLMQAEVGEAREAGGGSSAMPHKRNPAGCAVALASAARMPALMSTVLTSLVQEHERAAGTWHAEWPAIIEAVQVMGAAAEAMRQVASELTVDPARMRANLDATNGAIFAERVVMRAGRVVGRDVAGAMVKAALEKAREGGTSFGAAVRAMPELAMHLSADDLRSLDDPSGYLGSADDAAPPSAAIRERELTWRSPEPIRSAPTTGSRATPTSRSSCCPTHSGSTTACGIRRCRACCRDSACFGTTRAGTGPPTRRPATTRWRRSAATRWRCSMGSAWPEWPGAACPWAG